jgi:pimeloyl-ACP methyl ester carboxylesterase
MSPGAQVFRSPPPARWRLGLLILPAAALLAACDDSSGGPAMGIPGMVGNPTVPGMMVAPGMPGTMVTPPTPGMTPTPTPPGNMGTPGMPPAMPTAGPPGTFVEKPCAFTPAPARPVRCGTVSVPEARDGTSTSRLVQLAVVIVKSDSPTPEPDPLVFLQGGPGGGGTDFTVTLAGRMGGPLAAVLAKRDVLSIDQRGTGRSIPLLDCPEAAPGAMMPPPMGMVMDMGAAAALGRCRARLVGSGVDLNQYTTAAAADDVDDVRKALGHKQWNLLGGSYGTRLALEVVRRHPEGVRTLLLDSVSPPDVDLLGEAGPNSLRALEVVFKGCAAQAECARAYPELGKAFTQVIGGLNTTPASLLGGLLPLDGDTFLQVALLLLRSPATAAELPEIVFQAQDKRYTVVERLLLQLVMSMGGGGGAAGIAMGLHLSVMCADYLPFTSREAIDMRALAISPELRGPLVRASLGYLENCKVWNVRPSPPAAAQPVTSPVQSLVLAGSLDPATPPAWAERASKTLSASHYFELKGVSHGVFPTPCGSALLAPFLDAPGQKPAPACLSTLTDVAYRVQR